MRRRNIIVTAISLVVSLALMVFGVYAVSNPSINITGEVSYRVGDASLLIQGRLVGARDESGNSLNEDSYVLTDIPENVSGLSGTSITTTSASKYLNYTTSESFSSESSATLTSWSIGNINFTENASGVNDIKIYLQFTNYSKYPIMASVAFDTSDDNLSNLERSVSGLSENQVAIPQTGAEGSTKEIIVTYKVENDAVQVAAMNIGMTITFEQTRANGSAEGATSNSIADLDENSGVLVFGKTDNSLDENLKWRCFAYSTDGTTYQKYTSDTNLSEVGAQYAYFILDTYVSSMKYDYCINTINLKDDNGITSKYYNNTGNYASLGIYANDYSYSDLRVFIKNSTVDKLYIDTTSDLYNAIVGRTIEDLYTDNGFSGEADKQNGYESYSTITPPSGKGSEVDKFWAPSSKEMQTYFSNEMTYQDSHNSYYGDRILKLREDSTGGQNYYTRSFDISNTFRCVFISTYGTFMNYTATSDTELGVRVCFKLQLTA